jgi:hypothetical protein
MSRRPLPVRRLPPSAFVFLALASVAAGTACKKNDGSSAAGGYVQGQVGGPAGGAAAMPPGAGGAPGMPVGMGGAAPVGAYGGAPGTALPTQSGPMAQQLDPTAAAAVQPILAGLVKQNVSPGAKPVGQLLVGNFTQGQMLAMPIELQPKKCYTVIATGLPPVTDVNVQLELTTVLPGVEPVLAVDQDTGATAVLGKKSACYRWTLGVIPAPGKVVVQVKSGSGIVAAQAYEQ